MKRWWGAALALLILVACGGPRGNPAPDFTVPTLDGGSFTLSRALAQGKTVALFFMAYWCAPCLVEAEAWGRLQREYGDRLVVVALDVDPTSTPETLAAFRAAAGNPDYVWAFDRGNRVVLLYQVTRLDTTVIIDPHGAIVYRDEVPTSYATLAKQLRPLLGNPAR